MLGEEANFAGMSFLTLDKLDKLKYASDIVNVVADARLEHGPGLGTFAYDDEGVPAQCTKIIEEGQFSGYLSNAKPRSDRTQSFHRHDAHRRLEPLAHDPHDQRKSAAWQRGISTT